MGVKGKSGPKPGPVERKPRASAKPKATKEAKTTTPPAEAIPGHNLGPGEMTDDQKRFLAFQHADKIEKIKAQMATLNGDLRNFYKIAKADGYPKARIDRILMLRKDGGEELLREEFARDLEIARWLNLPFGTQADLFDLSAPDRRPAIERAFEDGKNAGMRALPKSPPHDPSVPQFKSWMDGYEVGQDVNKQLLANMSRPKVVADSEFERTPTANADPF